MKLEVGRLVFNRFLLHAFETIPRPPCPRRPMPIECAIMRICDAPKYVRLCSIIMLPESAIMLLIMLLIMCRLCTCDGVLVSGPGGTRIERSQGRQGPKASVLYALSEVVW